MTLYQYVAYKNPEGAKKVLNSYGQKAIRHPEALAKQLAQCVNIKGAKCLHKITSVHPDLKLITDFNEYNDEKDGKKACSCDDKTESAFSSAEGQAIKQSVEEIKQKQAVAEAGGSKTSDKSELMIVGAIVVIGLALILRK